MESDLDKITIDVYTTLVTRTAKEYTGYIKSYGPRNAIAGILDLLTVYILFTEEHYTEEERHRIVRKFDELAGTKTRLGSDCGVYPIEKHRKRIIDNCLNSEEELMNIRASMVGAAKMIMGHLENHGPADRIIWVMGLLRAILASIVHNFTEVERLRVVSMWIAIMGRSFRIADDLGCEVHCGLDTDSSNGGDLVKIMKFLGTV